MAYFLTTPLGHQVPIGDWKSYGFDQVLLLLYDFARVPFNDGTLVYSLASICNATRLDLDQAMAISHALVETGLAVEPAPGSGSFRITAAGIRTVHDALATGHAALV